MQTVISRQEAKAQGLKYYFTGKACSEGGVGQRLVCNGRCLCKLCLVKIKKQKQTDEQKHSQKRTKKRIEWRKNNPEKVIAIQKRSDIKKRLNNTPRKKEKVQGTYWERNQEKIRAYRNLPESKEARLVSKRKYKTNNKDKVRAESSKRRANRRQAVPKWFGEWDDFVMAEAFSLALIREKETGIVWHIDHMIPLTNETACGLHCAENIQVIPAYVNLFKRNLLLFTERGDYLNFQK